MKICIAGVLGNTYLKVPRLCVAFQLEETSFCSGRIDDLMDN